MRGSVKRANTLIKRIKMLKRIIHNPRAIIITISSVILTLHKGKLVKNLGTDSVVRLAHLVWL